MAANTRKRKSSPLNWGKILQVLTVAISIWFIFSFLIYPIITIVLEVFWQDGTFTFTAFEKVVRSNRAMKAVGNSFILAVALTLTANIVGTFNVLVTEYFDLKGSKLLRVGYFTPLVFGGVILASAYLAIYGRTGFVTEFLQGFIPDLETNWFQGFWPVLFVMTFAVTQNHMIFLRNAVQSLDNNVIEAAQNLGDSQWNILKKVVFPSLKPTFYTLIIMTFSTGIGAFSAPLMIGGNDFQTISPLILTFANRPASRDIAALLSIFLGSFQIVLLYIITWNERRGNYLSISKTKTRLKKQKITNPLVNKIVHVIAWTIFLIYVIPLGYVVLFSFMDTSAIARNLLSFEYFTFDNYFRILSDPATYGPFIRSITYSGIAAVISVFFMLMVVRLVMKNKGNRFVENLEYAFYIPQLIPAILLALGLILTYSTPSFLTFGQSAIGSMWVLPLAYTVMMLPSTLRYLKSAYYGFDENLEDASRILGASEVRTIFQILLPALLPTILALLSLNFNANLAEYNMSAFLYRPGFETLGVAIRSNADPTAAIEAKAINLVYSVILMAISAIVLYFIYGKGSTVSRRKGGEVK